LLLLSLFATASCRLHVIRLEMTALIPASNRLPDGSLLDDSGHWFKWVVLALILIVPLAFAFSGSPRPPLEPAALYAAPSAQYPWGTDGLGRDILTLGQLAIRHGWLIVLTGGLVSAGSGGLWSSGIMWLRNTRHHMLADGLRAPAEALILLAPAPLTLWFLLHLYAPASSPVAALGILTGIVLIPRMVWGMTRSKHVTLRPVSLLKRTGAHLAGAGFAALQMSFMAALIAGRGAAGLITPGGALAAYQDMIGGATLLNGGPYLRLALALALPGLALVWGWYLLADTLVDPQTVDGLADLLG